MRRLAAAAIVILVAGAAVLWILTRPKPARPLTLSLARVEFASLPAWKDGDVSAALAAFDRSCQVLLHLPADRPMGGAGYAGLAGDWRQVCTGLPKTADRQSAREWFQSTFVPFAVHSRPDRDALFTGYYEPQIRASRTRHAGFATPLYGLPRDFVTADLGLFKTELAGIRIHGHVVGSRFVPFPTRAEVDTAGLVDAPVLLYSDDPVAVFFLHIQGSGRALLDDGTMLRLAYAGQNGHRYTPIGRILIARGDLDRGHMSMQAIRAWLLHHPDSARTVMESDQSYVFFREAPVGDPQLGSPGTEGVPLTPEASIAVDARLHALGLPMYVTAQTPATDVRDVPRPFARLCIAQDTGGAIKGAARADIFWGFGPRAESLAGRMKSGGSLYVLLPLSVARRIGARFEAR